MKDPDTDRVEEAIASIRSVMTGSRAERPTPSRTIACIASEIAEVYKAEHRASTPPYEHRLALLEAGLPVPALSVCGQGTQEIRYTKLLSFFLDPHSPHGLGSRLLEAAFGDALTQLLQEPVDWQQACVIPEYGGLGTFETMNGPEQSQLDIFIHLPKQRAAVLVEQKLLSAEGQSRYEGGVAQLQKYSYGLAQAHPELIGRTHKVFLTPTASADPSDASWHGMTHGQLVERFLDLLESPEGVPGTKARHNLASLLSDLVAGPLAEDANAWRAHQQHLRSLRDDWRYYLRHRDEDPRTSVFDLMFRIGKAL